jgi:sterol desaturase/sphingolipid hydroxylase (fatty acid hydroxylase superfamily)
MLLVAVRHIPSTLLVFLSFGILLYCVQAWRSGEKLSIGAFLRFCFPWKHWYSHSTKVDVAIFLLSKITLRLTNLVMHLSLTFLVTFVVLRVKGHFHVRSPLHETFAADAVLLVFIFLLGDLSSFISHTTQHRIPALWEFHKVHHAATFLTPFTAQREHPVETLIDALFFSLFLVPPVAVAELCLNLSQVRILELGGMIEVFFTITFLRQLQHSHFPISFGPFDRLIISPVMHQVHHSTKPEHWNKNFGSRLAIWDWFHGSAFVLPKSERLSFGLGTEEDERGDYSSIVACYLRPLKGCYLILKSEFAKQISAARRNPPIAGTNEVTGDTLDRAPLHANVGPPSSANPSLH